MGLWILWRKSDWYIAHETAVCHNPHSSSKWGCGHLGSNALSVNVVSTENSLSLNVRTNITGLSVCLLRIGQLFTEFCQIAYCCVTTNRSVMNDVVYRIYEHLFTSYISLNSGGTDDNCTAIETYRLTNRKFKCLMSESRNNYVDPVMTYVVNLWTGKTYWL